MKGASAMRRRLWSLLLLTLPALWPAPARAQVRSLTLGIKLNCPYGLAL
jgi:hypothetical protein